MMRKLLCFLIIVLLVSAASAEPVFTPSVGSILVFGHYEQDNDLNNGPEPIEWIVLDVQDGKALLISQYGLDAKPYDKAPGRNAYGNGEVSTWETCTLRAWLNDDFYRAAFSTEEQTAILMTAVDNSSAQGYAKWNPRDENDTEDRLFILSYAEANRYLDVTFDDTDNERAQVVPTDYAIAQGAYQNKKIGYTINGRKTGSWWLRSPAMKSSISCVDYNGAVRFDLKLERPTGCVRPAFWLDLSAYSP